MQIINCLLSLLGIDYLLKVYNVSMNFLACVMEFQFVSCFVILPRHDQYNDCDWTNVC
jgi:hypothetical protein